MAAQVPPVQLSVRARAARRPLAAAAAARAASSHPERPLLRLLLRLPLPARPPRSWPVISAYLERNGAGGRWAKVLMADVRDAMFQSDPFAIVTSPGFYAFHGIESRTIGECGWNGGWIRDCFGAQMLQKVSRKTIICSGVSVGTYAEVKAYLSQMSAIMSEQRFAKCERNGVDQGVHNVLVHEQRIPGLKVFPQSSGLVQNLAAHKGVVRGGRVLAPSGALAAVVHQYDRYPELMKQYLQTYVYWEDTAALAARACARFELEPNVDKFKGVCDLTVKSGADAAECCEKCAQDAACRAFTHVGSMCYLKSCAQGRQRLPMDGATSAVRKN